MSATQVTPNSQPESATAGSPQANAQPSPTPEAQTYAKAFAFVQRLTGSGAKFTRDDAGEISLHYSGRIISLIPGSREQPNYDLDELMSLDGCPGTETPNCRYERKWIELIGRQRTKGTAAAHRFAATSKDFDRIYVPVADGILSISRDGIQKTVNVENLDGIVLEPAKGQEPFTLTDEPPAEGL